MAETKPVPRGYHTATPHLVVNDGPGALEFYKKAFDAEELERSPTPDGSKLMHATIRIGDSPIMLNDEFPDMGARAPKSIGGTPVTIHLYVDDADQLAAQAERAGATVLMPVDETFWGDRYGIVEDPYGHHWAIATHVRDVPREEMEAAAKKMFGG